MKKYTLVSLLCLTSFLSVSLKAFALQTPYDISSYGKISYPEPPQARGNIFSVSIWTGASDYFLQKTAELGVGWVRIGNGGNWRIIEPQKGVYNWESADRIVNWARANGIEPYIDVIYTPDWATSKEPYNKKNPPDDLNDYRNFVYQLVKRYNLEVVSIWHEPHIFFHGSIDEYVELTKAGYEGAKQANPNCKVLGNFGHSPKHIYDSDFPLDGLVQRGFFNYIDALTTSTYTGGRIVGPEGSLAIWLEDLRDYLIAQGKPDMEFWDGAFGYSIAPEDVDTPAGGHWTLEEQADLTVRHCQVILADPHVKFTNYWPLHGSGNGVYYTLIDMDTLEPRPVYYAYQDFISTHV
ncbi:MAG: endo-1,4-beta-xylanase [Candidatus Heimdallarchaeota archaeon]